MATFGKTYSANDDIIKAAKKQAKYAEDRELDRNERLEYGRALIDSLFKGGKYTGMKLDRTVTDKKTGEESKLKYDPEATYYTKDGKVWKPAAQTKGTKTLTGYKTTKGSPAVPGKQVQIPANTSNTRAYGSGGRAINAGTPSSVKLRFPGSQKGAGNWYYDTDGNLRQVAVGKPYYDSSGDLRYDSGDYARSASTRASSDPYTDPDGNIRYGLQTVGGHPAVPGTRVPYQYTVDTLTGPTAANQWKDADLYSNAGGEFSGIGDDFYDNYRKAILDFQLPDLAKQYRKAQSQDLFSMARQGIMNSSAAIGRRRDRSSENDKAITGIETGAEAQVTGLESDMDAARRKTIALLETTESPTRAIDEGLSEINAVQNSQPDLSPLGDIFNAAAQGFQSYQNTQAQRRYNDLLKSVATSRNSGRTYV